MTLAGTRPASRSGRAARGAAATGAALRLWLGSRVAVAVLAVAGAWTVGQTTAGTVPSFLRLWDRWDVGLFVKIARWGYFGYPQHYPDKGVVAFFPGEPLLLRAVHAVVRSWVAGGLLISLAAGAVAAAALVRLGRHEGSAETGERALLYLVLSPFAVFLAAGYSEALFLAFAVPAWLAGRQRRWQAAGLLGAAAAFVRVTGVFLAVALLVEYVVRERRARPSAGWLLAPFGVLAGWSLWLHARTGDWLAWQHAQALGWGRHFTAPWHAFATTWDAAWNDGQGAAYAWSFRAEILAVLVGVALTLALLGRRRWGEATYVGLQVAALATSSFYLSVGRATLLWWPLWLLLAEASRRRPWVHTAYLSVAPALMAAYVVAFTQGHWVG